MELSVKQWRALALAYPLYGGKAATTTTTTTAAADDALPPCFGVFLEEGLPRVEAAFDTVLSGVPQTDGKANSKNNGERPSQGEKGGGAGARAAGKGNLPRRRLPVVHTDSDSSDADSSASGSGSSFTAEEQRRRRGSLAGGKAAGGGGAPADARQPSWRRLIPPAVDSLLSFLFVATIGGVAEGEGGSATTIPSGVPPVVVGYFRAGCAMRPLTFTEIQLLYLYNRERVRAADLQIALDDCRAALQQRLDAERELVTPPSHSHQQQQQRVSFSAGGVPSSSSSPPDPAGRATLPAPASDFATGSTYVSPLAHIPFTPPKGDDGNSGAPGQRLFSAASVDVVCDVCQEVGGELFRCLRCGCIRHEACGGPHPLSAVAAPSDDGGDDGRAADEGLCRDCRREINVDGSSSSDSLAMSTSSDERRAIDAYFGPGSSDGESDDTDDSFVVRTSDDDDFSEESAPPPDGSDSDSGSSGSSSLFKEDRRDTRKKRAGADRRGAGAKGGRAKRRRRLSRGNSSPSSSSPASGADSDSGVEEVRPASRLGRLRRRRCSDDAEEDDCLRALGIAAASGRAASAKEAPANGKGVKKVKSSAVGGGGAEAVAGPGRQQPKQQQQQRRRRLPVDSSSSSSSSSSASDIDL